MENVISKSKAYDCMIEAVERVKILRKDPLYAKSKEAVAENMTKEHIAEAQDLSREMVKANPKLIN